MASGSCEASSLCVLQSRLRTLAAASSLGCSTAEPVWSSERLFPADKEKKLLNYPPTSTFTRSWTSAAQSSSHDYSGWGYSGVRDDMHSSLKTGLCPTCFCLLQGVRILSGSCHRIACVIKDSRFLSSARIVREEAHLCSPCRRSLCWWRGRIWPNEAPVSQACSAPTWSAAGGLWSPRPSPGAEREERGSWTHGEHREFRKNTTEQAEGNNEVWMKRWSPVLHLLTSVMGQRQVFIKTTVRRVPRGVIDDSCISENKIYGFLNNPAIFTFWIFTPFWQICLYLCAAAVAAASIANCLMVLSSRYFCSHLVISASRARIRSSFSLRCCCNLDELGSEAVESVLWFWDWNGRQNRSFNTQGNKML